MVCGDTVGTEHTVAVALRRTIVMDDGVHRRRWASFTNTGSRRVRARSRRQAPWGRSTHRTSRKAPPILPRRLGQTAPPTAWPSEQGGNVERAHRMAATFPWEGWLVPAGQVHRALWMAGPF